MISRLSGLLVLKNPPQLLLDVSGVGYEILVPMSTFYLLPACNEKIVLLTHFIVREDGHFLYGFLSESERSTFRALIKISGIGPRTALAILSGLSVDELSRAVALQEGGRLQKVPGIGKKTADRLLLELKGKLSGMVSSAPSPVDDARQDILNALLSLGYSEKEARHVLETIPVGLSASDGIRQALKQLVKN